MRTRALGVLLLAGILLPALGRAQGHDALTTRDGLDVWAVGDSGRFYRSLDGGASWGYGSLGSKPLHGVAARGVRVFVVGDSGRVWKSVNSGGSWSFSVVGGIPALRAVDFPNDTIGYVVGDGGTLIALRGFGDTLQTLSSGTGVRLNAVRFTDTQHGWIVGAGGFAASTADGGASWTPVGLGTTNDLRAVDVVGATVWIGGDNGTALRSDNGGVSFDPVNLKLDARADVRAVSLGATPDTVTLGGGGGFIRRSTDGGATWSYPVHRLHGTLTDLAFARGRGFACSSRHRCVISSADGGLTWNLPAGGAVTRSWVRKLDLSGNIAQVRGNTFALNPVYKNEIYVMIGFYAGNVKLYQSRDDGETWNQIGTTILTQAKASAFVVSPKDSNLMVAAVSDPGAVLRSTNGFTSWSQTHGETYGEYSVPIEMHPDKPDTLFFAGDSVVIQRSIDFGATWNPYSTTVFREPIDLVVLPDSNNVVVVGDGITGVGNEQILQSTDSGLNFSVVQSGSGAASEIPAMAGNRLRNTTLFATSWSTGGVLRSQDAGATWGNVAGTNAAWGVDIARDDPNAMIFGVFSGGQSYLSLDGGTTFTPTALSGANYSFYARDRGLILAQQSTGVWKMTFQYPFTPSNEQSVTVISPNGGEVWSPGQTRTITWDPMGIALARIEYRTSTGGPWIPIADVDGYTGRYDWLIPELTTTHARVRVSDAWDTNPTDLSNADFTISGVVGVEAGGEPGFFLAPARPNPFGGATTLSYRLPERTPVRLEVFDVQGERVAVLVDGVEEAGSHTVSFDVRRPGAGRRGGALASGVYFVRLGAGALSTTRKILLMK